ncbi:hypothetical protein HDU67_000142 [Dinochytrium kinnereticum]|nr:hypothetical protein HDU67_000142 [Dinochytrium kinnereticum]
MAQQQQLAVHEDVSCDSCNHHPIIGTRFMCGNCVEFDLCSACIGSCRSIHDPSHVFLVLDRPTGVRLVNPALPILFFPASTSPSITTTPVTVIGRGPISAGSLPPQQPLPPPHQQQQPRPSSALLSDASWDGLVGSATWEGGSPVANVATPLSTASSTHPPLRFPTPVISTPHLTPSRPLPPLTRFSVRLLQSLLQVSVKPEPHVIFPISLWCSLGLAAIGARGRTFSELVRILEVCDAAGGTHSSSEDGRKRRGCDEEMAQDDMHLIWETLVSEMQGCIPRFTVSGGAGNPMVPSTTLRIANGVVVDRRLPLMPGYQNLVGTVFGGRVFGVDVATMTPGSGDDVLHPMRSWVYSKCYNGYGPPLAPPPPGPSPHHSRLDFSNRMSIFSALHLSAPWKNPPDVVREEGGPVLVFRDVETWGVGSSIGGREACRAFRIPLGLLPVAPIKSSKDTAPTPLSKKRGTLSLLILTTLDDREGSSPSILIPYLPQALTAVLDGGNPPAVVSLRLPALRSLTPPTASLVPALKALGMSTAFDAAAADFGGMLVSDDTSGAGSAASGKRPRKAGGASGEGEGKEGVVSVVDVGNPGVGGVWIRVDGEGVKAGPAFGGGWEGIKEEILGDSGMARKGGGGGGADKLVLEIGRRGGGEWGMVAAIVEEEVGDLVMVGIV